MAPSLQNWKTIRTSKSYLILPSTCACFLFAWLTLTFASFSYSLMDTCQNLVFRMRTEGLGVWYSNLHRRRMSFQIHYILLASKQRWILAPLVWVALQVFSEANTKGSWSHWNCWTRFIIELVDRHLHLPNTNLLAKSSLRNDFLREAVAWRSLSHRFILPFFGIYEEKSRAFLVSPFMTNGTLSEWRKKQTQAVAEVHRLVRRQWLAKTISRQVS